MASRRSKVPLILSGGLDCENVAAAIAATGPYAVDSASGTESSPGHKDLGRLAALVHAGRVTVAMCEASTQQFGVLPSMLAPFVRSTPVGVVEIARLQSQGFAYLTVTSSR